MPETTDAIGELDRRIAAADNGLAAIKREMTAQSFPPHVLNWLTDFVAVAELKRQELCARRAQLQHRQ